MSNDDNSPPDLPDERLEPSDEISLPLEILEGIPEDKREELNRFLLQIRTEKHYSGPLQHAGEAAVWNELVQGSAERSFNLYEQQQLTRMAANDRILTVFEETARQEREIENKRHNDNVRLTNTELKNSADEVRRGQLFAFVVVFGIIAGGFTMIHLGHDNGGIASLLVAAASVAGIFVSQFAKDRIIGPRSESARESASSDSQP